MLYFLRRRGLGLKTLRAIQDFLVKDFNEESVIIHSYKKIPILKEGDILLRWGCTTQVPGTYITLNKANAITFTSNKTEFRKHLQEIHPNIVPQTCFKGDIITWGMFPLILRHEHHAQGKFLWYCENRETFVENFNDYYNTYGKNTNYYLSKYIPKVKEYRICFVQNRVAWIAEKIVENLSTIAWNVAQGGKFINVRWKDWPLDTIEKALLAHKESGLFLSGVDIMVDDEGRSYIIEVNSAPSHTSPYRQSCVAKCLSWCIQNMHWDNMPLNEEYNKYRKYTHPGLTND